MNRSAAVAIVAGVLAAGTAGAQMKAHVLIVESEQDLHDWVKTPVTTMPAPMRVLPAGKKIWFPIVVSGLKAGSTVETRVVGDIEFFGPAGKSIWASKKCCSADVRGNPEGRFLALAPAAHLQLEPKDPPGVYRVVVTMSDGTAHRDYTESFRYDAPPAQPAKPKEAPAAKKEAPAEKAVKRAGPTLEMSEESKRASEKQADKRHCLDLPTSQEVIKCTQRK